VNRTKQAEHMAAPTTAANVKKALANSEPSTHGGQEFESLRARHKHIILKNISYHRISAMQHEKFRMASAWNKLAATKATAEALRSTEYSVDSAPAELASQTGLPTTNGP
jgi:hypothetical protein